MEKKIPVKIYLYIYILYLKIFYECPHKLIFATNIKTNSYNSAPCHVPASSVYLSNFDQYLLVDVFSCLLSLSSLLSIKFLLLSLVVSVSPVLTIVRFLPSNNFFFCLCNSFSCPLSVKGPMRWRKSEFVSWNLHFRFLQRPSHRFRPPDKELETAGKTTPSLRPSHS